MTAIDEKPAAATKKRKRAVGQKSAPSDPLPTPAHTNGSSPIEPPRSSQLLPLLPPVSARNLPEGVAYIAEVDPSFQRLIDAYGSPHSLIISTSSTFGTLTRSIVSQQLSTTVATIIYSRIVSACQCETAEQISPAAVLSTSREDLRACGLSGQKASYLLDLATHYADSRLSCDAIRGMTEEDLVKKLTSVKGIGKWTADMFSMFSLGRPDILPVGDLGIRKGFAVHFGLKELPDATEMEKLAEPWRPWRSIGSFYMWRLCEEQKPKKKKSK